jgi:hypothetical protein
MKKTNRKLVLHRETLQNLDLREVTGGQVNLATNLSQANSCYPYRCVPTQTPACASHTCTSV